MLRRAILLGLLLVVAATGGAGAATTTHDASGTIVLDGRRAFPIVLAKGPSRGGTTLDGSDATAEVIRAGATFLKIGPATVPWTDADIADARLDDADAAAKGGYTWVNLSTVSRATPGSASDALLQKVVGALEGDPAVAMWKGADEPWWSHFDPASLQFSYCRSTGRGDPGWCGGEQVLDSEHEWVTIQAPRGDSTDLAPYSAVTDVHGVDVYPVTLRAADPNLHDVGTWTRTMADITPSHSVWTTLQICASGSYDTSTGQFVLPTRAQERYMIYDAIINGARMLAFFGGNNPRCWNAADTEHEWSWTFWNTVLKGLVGEINAISPLAPALVNADTTQVLHTSDPTTQVIARAGNASDLWVMAARGGTGTAGVTIDGLPPTVTSGTVYTEGRSVPVANGSFTDAFDRWGVHVYHFDVPAAPPPAQPTISSFAPASGGAGTLVTIAGTNLAGATSVTFGGAAAGFTQVSPTEVTATVPAAAASGPIALTTPGGTATSATSFTVTAPVPPSESPNPGGSSGGQAGPAPAPPPAPAPAPTPAAPATPAAVAGAHATRVRATSHADRLVGTSRRDTLRGLGGGDTILGLAGDDLLDGGIGNDTLVGGKGRDLLYGRAGNDVLSVRDGTRDRVSCGKGRDRVIADRRDAVSRDCERVVRR
jgi:hypothetical protein